MSALSVGALSIGELATRARAIADSRREDDRTSAGYLSGTSHESNTALTIILDSAMSGDMKLIQRLAPAVAYAVTLDVSEAHKLLNKAQLAERVRQTFGAADYRAAANRKLAEAASWLY